MLGDVAGYAKTGGKGVDHVVDIGGAGTLVQSLKSVRFGGHIQAVGFVAQGVSTCSRLSVPRIADGERVVH